MVLVLPDAFQLILRHRVVQLLMVPGHQTFGAISKKERVTSIGDPEGDYHENCRGWGVNMSRTVTHT